METIIEELGKITRQPNPDEPEPKGNKSKFVV
jgi:hypothetical protein